MSAVRARAAAWRAIARIRRLQSRVAELDVARAGGERETAAQRHARAEQLLDQAQSGWAGAIEGAFDPGLARHWFAKVDRERAGERQAGETLREADTRLEEKRGDWHAAEARGEVAEERSRRATAGAARRAEEARLAESEDRFAGQRKRR